jgi:exocyst complex component 4
MNGRNGYADGYPDPGRSNRYDGGYGVDNNNSISSSGGSISGSGRDRRAGGYGGFYGSPQQSNSSLDALDQSGRPSTSSSRPRMFDVVDAARRRGPGPTEGGGYGESGTSRERARAGTNGETSSSGNGQRITGEFNLRVSLFCRRNTRPMFHHPLPLMNNG